LIWPRAICCFQTPFRHIIADIFAFDNIHISLIRHFSD
jgi:hypothetical protein